MVTKIRKSDTNEWGFLESYKKHSYAGRGYIKALTTIDTNGALSPCYVYRNGEFISVSLINEEVGLSKYIKAKKPFYSMFKDGFIVVLKAEVDFNNKIYYPETSTFEVYKSNTLSVESDSIALKRILNIPDGFRKLVEEPLKILGESFGDRELFLEGR